MRTHRSTSPIRICHKKRTFKSQKIRQLSDFIGQPQAQVENDMMVLRKEMQTRRREDITISIAATMVGTVKGEQDGPNPFHQNLPSCSILTEHQFVPVNRNERRRERRRPGSHSQRKWKGQRFLPYTKPALLRLLRGGLCEQEAVPAVNEHQKKKLLRNDLAEKTTDLTVKHDDSLSSLSSYEIVRNLLTVFGQLRTTTVEAKRRQQHSQIRQKMHWT